MCSIETIVDWNNTAVAQMAEGHHRSAAVGLRNALGALRAAISSAKTTDEAASSSPIDVEQPSETPPSLMDCTEEDCCDRMAKISQDGPDCPKLLEEVVVTSIAQGSLLSVFNKAVVLPHIETLSENDTCVVSTVLLYNLGLAHHCSAIVAGDRAEDLFRRAQVFYKMAIEVLQKDLCWDTTYPLAEILSLAITINMGHIFSCFFDAMEARRCLEWIASILGSIDGAFLGDDNF